MSTYLWQVWKCSGQPTSSTWRGSDEQVETVLQVRIPNVIQIGQNSTQTISNEKIETVSKWPQEQGLSKVSVRLWNIFSNILLFSYIFSIFSIKSLLLVAKSHTKVVSALTCWERNFSMVSLGRGFSNDWDMSTSKRNFKFSQEVAATVNRMTIKYNMSISLKFSWIDFWNFKGVLWCLTFNF